MKFIPSQALVLALSIFACLDVSAQSFILRTNEFAGPPLVGYGVELSPYLTAPNAGQPQGDLADLEKKLKALAPQHVRIFVRTDWWKPGNEKVRDSFVRTCQLAQTAGATINVTLWTGWEANPPESALDMAQLLKDLIVNHSLTAVRYVTLQNEVNSTKVTMTQYNEFYRLFDTDLRKAGIRDKLQIVGGDLVRNNQAAWLRDLATELPDVCEGHSVHIYWNFPAPEAEDAIQRLRGIAKMSAALPEKGRRPMYIMEFGVRGNDRKGPGKDPGFYLDGTPITQTGISALEIGWLMTEATRLGFVSTVEWEAYDMAYGKHPMHYGIMGEPGEGWPLRPAYQVLRLYTHTIAPGWRALAIDGDSPNAALAVTQGPGSELTIMALNHSTKPQTVTLAGVPSAKVFHQIIWTATDPSRLQDSADVQATTGPLELKLPPQSLTAFAEKRWQ